MHAQLASAVTTSSYGCLLPLPAAKGGLRKKKNTDGCVELIWLILLSSCAHIENFNCHACCDWSMSRNLTNNLLSFSTNPRDRKHFLLFMSWMQSSRSMNNFWTNCQPASFWQTDSTCEKENKLHLHICQIHSPHFIMFHCTMTESAQTWEWFHIPHKRIHHKWEFDDIVQLVKTAWCCYYNHLLKILHCPLNQLGNNKIQECFFDT